MKVHHHNEKIDFEKIINQLSSKYIGLDTSDFNNFLSGGAEIHSFVSIKTGENRIKGVLAKIFKSDEIQGILHKANSFMIIFLHSIDSHNSLSLEEIQESNEILDQYLKDKNVLWGIIDDKDLKDSSKIIVLARI